MADVTIIRDAAGRAIFVETRVDVGSKGIKVTTQEASTTLGSVSGTRIVSVRYEEKR